MNIAFNRSLAKTLAFVIALLLGVQGRAEPRIIDLAEALRLADAGNADIAIQVENAKQASIESQQAWMQWLPSLRYGMSYAHQDGLLQETNGNLLDAERNGRFDGFGAGGLGAGLAGQPGLSLELNLADAVFDPKGDRQRQQVAAAQTESTRLRVMTQVADAYYELARSQHAVSLAETAAAQAQELAKVTGNFAKAGEGESADAERAAVEALLQQQRLEEARFAVQDASAGLAALLQVKGDLQAASDALAPIKLSHLDQSLEGLLASAQKRRPENRAAEAHRKAAAADERKTTLSPLIPRVGAAYSDTDFGGGVGSNNNADGSREETAVAVYWQFDQLGFGSLNSKRIAQSKLRQSETLERQAAFQVASDVARAHARWVSAQSQLDLAKEMVERARKAYELDRARIFENQALPLETLQSQQTLAQTEMSYVNAVVRYNTAQLRLAAAIGQPLSE